MLLVSRVWVPKLPVGLALLAAFWPVWVWTFRRTFDGSDEPWGIVALLTAAAFLWRTPAAVPGTAAWRPVREGLCTFAAAAVVLTYAASFPWLPPLGRGLLATVALGWWAASRSAGGAGALGWWGLLLLGLPVVATAQFFLGYPLRVLTAAGSAGLLDLAGLGVERAGTVLRWRGELVMVDAPCSGVKMLWGGGFLTCSLLAARRVRPLPSAVAAAGAVGIILAANCLRSTLLFFKEAGVWALPDWTHAGFGVVLFALAALGIVGLIHRLPTPVPAGEENGLPVGVAPRWTLLAACALAGIVPLGLPTGRGEAVDHGGTAAEWPVRFEGLPLAEQALGKRERAFAADFPGEVKVFTDTAGRQLICRRVLRPTRRLHPASDCFRGLGCRVEIQPPRVHSDNTRWGHFSATRDGRTLRVSERITDDTGHAWSDVSAWYWDATLGRTRGPWWALVVVE